MAFFNLCAVCECYAHVECQDFVVSDCKECATYVPQKNDLNGQSSVSEDQQTFIIQILRFICYLSYCLLCNKISYFFVVDKTRLQMKPQNKYKFQMPLR